MGKLTSARNDEMGQMEQNGTPSLGSASNHLGVCLRLMRRGGVFLGVQGDDEARGDKEVISSLQGAYKGACNVWCGFKLVLKVNAAGIKVTTAERIKTAQRKDCLWDMFEDEDKDKDKIKGLIWVNNHIANKEKDGGICRYIADYYFKEDYTIVPKPRAVVYRDKNYQRKLMRLKELHKFSDGTLIRVMEKLDHMVKDFHLFEYNKGMETRKWPEDDKRRRKDFITAIEKRLQIRRIFRSLESFVGGRIRDIDYRLINRTT
ncbi:hypothetical protein Tco_1367364 [Tanacetum coccineum]